MEIETVGSRGKLGWTKQREMEVDHSFFHCHPPGCDVYVETEVRKANFIHLDVTPIMGLPALGKSSYHSGSCHK